MKRDGTHNLFKPSDVTRYPFFYIELSYAVTTLLGIVLYVLHSEGELGARLPNDASAAWQAAASQGGILLLLVFSTVACIIGLYGLFRGGFKWRATHMFLQFLIRLYVTVGALAVFGLWPTGWINSLLLAVVAGIVYLKLRMEQRTYENGY